MNLKLSPLALLLILLPIAIGKAQEADSQEAKRWLERMIQAAQSLSYEGTFVYVQGPHLDAMHIIHGGAHNGERQRMFSLNGSLREVLVSDNYVTCLLSKQKLAFNAANYSQRSPFPISLPRELDKLEQNYQFEMLGDDRVAGMETQIVAIKPRDQWRFGYWLWLERQTGMVLRSALLNEKGELIEQLMFTNVQIKPEIDPDLLTSPPPSSPSAPADANITSQVVTRSDWVVSNLPAGFTQVMHNRFSTAGSKDYSTEHIVFTDGLATISVFVEALNKAEPLLVGLSQIGAMNAYGVTVADHQVMVIGEVPPTAVQRIASSVRYVPGGAAK